MTRSTSSTIRATSEVVDPPRSTKDSLRERRRTHGIIEALTSADVMTFADKAYQGARGGVRSPFKRRRFRPKLSRRQKAVNRANAEGSRPGRTSDRHPQDLEDPGRAAAHDAERGGGVRHHLAKLRYCARRATAIAQAILVLHHVENPIYAG
jgi:hypothetical protein